MQPMHEKPGRAPKLADRDGVPEDELSVYDEAYELVLKYSADNEWSAGRPRVEGEPYAFSYRVAWTNAPILFSALNQAASVTTYLAGTPGYYQPADHELVEFTLGFDAGYWAFHAGHTANAIVAGVRTEALRSLRTGKEEGLTDDEKLIVRFTRAVRDGEMTDDLWNQMIERIGTLKGTIGLAYQVSISNAILQMMSVFGVPAITPDDWDQLIEAYEKGDLNAGAHAHSYVTHTLENQRQ